jgi:hypothetical protein
MAIRESRRACAALIVIAACGGPDPVEVPTVVLDQGQFAAADAPCPPTAARPAPARSAPAQATILRASTNLRAPADAAPRAAADLYVRAALPATAAPLEVHSVLDRGGVRVVKYRQVVDGVDVFRHEVNVVMRHDNTLVAITGAPALSPRASVRRAAIDPDTAARQAIAIAAQDAGLGARALVADDVRPPYRRYLGHGALTSARARPTLFDTGSALVDAWYTELQGVRAGHPTLRSAVVDAATGAVLYRNDKTRFADPFAYRAYADATTHEPAISPFCGQGFPHPTGAPDGYTPTTACAQQLVSLVSADHPLGDPWLPAGATETHGNNVDAFFHVMFDATGNFNPDGFAASNGDFHAHTTAPGVFDYPYDVAASPTDYFEGDAGPLDPTSPHANAKIVQGFYIANYLHDLTYAQGYDEASGNPQQDNFGRGGKDGDPLLIYAGAPDTYTFPTADGQSPIVVMGLNYRSQLRRDATLDLTVFAHEWAHVLEFRMIGDSEGLSNEQGSAMAEGWSDFFGLLAASRADQATATSNPAWTGAFAEGLYFNQAYCDTLAPPLGTACDGPDQNFYFGARRYPYTVDMARSPLTFRYISNGLALPAGIPERFWKGRIENAELHSAGEIWASALWGSYRSLLLDSRYTFAQAKARMIGYVIAGMKATPIDPTFLEARDAILAVVRASDDQDYAHFRAAFAARGMGAGAVAPPRTSNDLRGAIESTSVDGPALAYIGATLADIDGDHDGILDVGEHGTLTVTVRNSGSVALAATAVTVQAVDGDVEVGAGATGRALAPNQDLVIDVPVTLRTATFDQAISFDVVIADAAAGVAPITTRVGFRVDHDVVATATDHADNPAAQAAWFGEPYIPYQETVWARVDHAGNPAYEVTGTRIRRTAALVSPCFQVAKDRDLVVHFAQSYFDIYGGDVQVKVGGAAPDAWQTIYSLPATGQVDQLTPVDVNLHRDQAGAWLQLQFVADVPEAVGAAVPRWTIDDISLDGVTAPPFRTIGADGAAAH